MNIEVEYDTIESSYLATKALSTYTSGKGFAYDHIHQEKVVPLKREADSRVYIKINPQKNSLKAILLLCVEAYVAGTRDTEKYPYID